MTFTSWIQYFCILDKTEKKRLPERVFNKCGAHSLLDDLGNPALWAEKDFVRTTSAKKYGDYTVDQAQKNLL